MFGIELIKNYGVSLSRQIYSAVRDLIIKGSLQADETLPSTRELSKQLSVSRNTVCEAYEMLIAEGYIISRQGALSKVAKELFLQEPQPQPKINKTAKLITPEILYDFSTGRPDFANFPKRLWFQSRTKAIDQMPLSHLGYTGPEGILELREQIAAWLFRSRGIRVDAQDIFITTGATQALYLLAKILSATGKKILVEDPCHIGMLRALQNNNIKAYPIPVDFHGIKSNCIKGSEPCAVYVTPSHQFPLGGILPANRRTALIRFARETNSYIIEDDYDSEFRFCGAKVSPLYSLDNNRVIYVGTFSKILFPSLRIGYVILPKQLQNSWSYMRTYMDVQNPSIEQYTLCDFLSSRKLDRHVQKMSRLYGQRRKILLNTLNEQRGILWKVCGDAAGLHLVLTFSDIRFYKDFHKKCRESGINISTVDYYSVKKGAHLDKLLLGYAHLSSKKISDGVVHLFHFIKDYSR